MGRTILNASEIKNKAKRETFYRKEKKTKGQEKLQKRIAQAKLEAQDPALKKKRLEENVPQTLDSMREFDPAMLVANPAASSSKQPSTSTGVPEESALDIASDPFATYFNATSADPNVPPKVLITTSPKASRVSRDFCEELIGIFPGAEFVKRKHTRKGFEMGWIAAWAAGRDYSGLIVVNENRKTPNAMTIVHLPDGPTAFFKLTSIQLSKRISGHARQTSHFPELILNGFVTRLGFAVGRMFQTMFPPMPEFEGRQVVTLHNQRDFLFFRRHRYAFRSPEKAALQEIGPRFTLKLRWIKKSIPSVKDFGQQAKPLQFARDEFEGMPEPQPDADDQPSEPKKITPPTHDEYIWMWKPELETSRKTFFL